MKPNKECIKIKLTEEESDLELRRIVEENDYRSWKRQSPHRRYICPYCSQGEEKVYHLSSKPSITIY